MKVVFFGVLLTHTSTLALMLSLLAAMVLGLIVAMAQLARGGVKPMLAWLMPRRSLVPVSVPRIGFWRSCDDARPLGSRAPPGVISEQPVARWAMRPAASCDSSDEQLQTILTSNHFAGVRTSPDV